MSNQKFSIDDILNEYSSEGKKNKQANIQKNYLDDIVNESAPTHTKAYQHQDSPHSDNISADAKTNVFENIPQNHNEQPAAAPTLLNRSPDGNYDKFLNSHEESPYPTEKIKPLTEDYDSGPKIRRMKDSSRAKELKSRSKKPSSTASPYRYSKESANDVYSSSSSPSPSPSPKKNPSQEKSAEHDNSQKNKRKYYDPEQFKNTEIADNLSESVKSKSRKKEHSADDPRKIAADLFNLKSGIILRIIVLSVMALFSIYIAFANDYSLPTLSAFKMRTAPQSYVITMIILGGISIVSSISVITGGFTKLFSLKADSDSLTALTAAACVISAFAAVITPGMLEMGVIHIYMPIAILALLFNSVSKLLIISRASRNLDYITLPRDKYAVVFIEDERKSETLTRGTMRDYPILTAMRKTDSMSDFLKYTFSSDHADKFCKIFAPAVLIASLLAAVVSLVKFGTADSALDAKSITLALSILSMCISSCCCLAVPFIANIPLLSASKTFSDDSGALLGYQSVDDFYDTNSILIDAANLFPKGSVSLSAIKPYSDVKIDDAIILASSLTIHAGSILKDMFGGMIQNNETMLYPVENFAYEDSLGISGWINNKRVLLGSRTLMTSHNIEGIPSKSKEFEYTENGKDAVYLSVSGNLAAIFIVELNPSPNVKYYLEELQDENIYMIVKSIDSVVSISKIAKVFGISEEMIKIIPQKLHKLFDSETTPVKKQSASIVCSGKFEDFIRLVLTSRTIRQITLTGTVLQWACGILGFAMCAVFIAMNAYMQISPSALIFYHLVWFAITVFVIKVRRL